jgi:hypothetical protein
VRKAIFQAVLILAIFSKGNLWIVPTKNRTKVCAYVTKFLFLGSLLTSAGNFPALSRNIVTFRHCQLIISTVVENI